MEITYTTRNGRLTVKIEADTHADAWRELARFQEIFEDTDCTMDVNGQRMTSDNTRFVIRENDENEFFELVCVEPGPLRYARRSYGLTKKGGYLFPHRKDKEKKYLPNNGWTKYVKPNSESSSTPPPVVNEPVSNATPF